MEAVVRMPSSCLVSYQHAETSVDASRLDHSDYSLEVERPLACGGYIDPQHAEHGSFRGGSARRVEAQRARYCDGTRYWRSRSQRLSNAPRLGVELSMSRASSDRRTCSVVRSGICLLTSMLLSLPLQAQEQPDVVRGRVTSAQETSINGAVVSVTAFGTTITRTVRTNANGIYSLIFPGTRGDYIVAVTAIGFRVNQRRVQRSPSAAPDDPVVADFRMAPHESTQLDTVKITESRRRRVQRGDNTDANTGISATQEVRPGALSGDMTGDLATIASTIPGVAVAPGGFSVLGLDPSQNSIAVGGMTYAGSVLPRSAIANASVMTTSYDPSQGGYSGAQLTVSVFSVLGPSRSMELTVDHPSLQSIDPVNRRLRGGFADYQLSGSATNKIFGDKGSYSASGQLGHRTSGLPSLPVGNAAALGALGLATDSVTRLLSLAAERGLPLGARLSDSRTATNGSVLAVVNLTPTSDRWAGVTALGSWNSTEGGGLGPTSDGAGRIADRSVGGMLSMYFTQYFRSSFLSTTRVAFNGSDQSGHSLLAFPATHVRVASDLGGAVPVLATVRLGGSGYEPPRARSWSAEAKSDISWFTLDSRHRFQVGVSGLLDGFHTSNPPNSAGTFTFASIEDFEASTASMYTRTLSSHARSGRHLTGSAWLSDVWRPRSRLRVLSGARLEASYFPDTPVRNLAVEQRFGLRTDLVPSSVALLPGIGFTWTYGTLPVKLGGDPSGRESRATVTGGVSERRGALSSRLLDRVLGTAGELGGTRELLCVGAAAPVPTWQLYATNPTTLPQECADGSASSPLAEVESAIGVYDPDYAPTRSRRASVAWRSQLTQRLSGRVEVVQSWERNQPSEVDPNFASVPQFVLADEGGRPIFVSTAGIVPATGATTARESRLDPDFGRVSLYRSDLHATRTQFLVTLARQAADIRNMLVLGYTYLLARDETRGFRGGTTGGDPARAEWSRASGDGQHRLTLSGGGTVRNTLSISAFASLTSGRRYTPSVAGDVNGDGLANDRAFVFDPSEPINGDMSRGMAELLANAPEGARACLRAQQDRVAAANSCKGPWTASLHLRARLHPGAWGTPRRVSMGITLLNALSAADVLLHGSSGARGWGQLATPDPVLLSVRSFDPSAKRFSYNVNPRFGRTHPERIGVWNPFRVNVSVSVDLGPDSRRDVIDRLVRPTNVAGGSAPPAEEDILRRLPGTVNLAILVLLNPHDTIVRLTPSQRDSLVAIEARLAEQSRAAWLPVARRLVALGTQYDVDEIATKIDAAEGKIAAHHATAVAQARALLTPDQLRRLPPQIARQLSEQFRRPRGTLLGTIY